MNNKLTKREEQILNYIKDTLNEKEYAPTIREICEAVGLKSTASVHEYLISLHKKGYIKKPSYAARTLIPVSKETQTVEADVLKIPVIGNVAAGQPILAEENIEDYFSISQSFLGKKELKNDTFILKVKGDSMINVGIHNGDYIIVCKTNTANNGETIVAMIEDGATVKTYRDSGKKIWLQPENDNLQPIYTPFNVIGKVIGVFRKI